MKALIITALLILTTQAIAQECDRSKAACPVINLDRQCYNDCRDQGYATGYCLKQCQY